MTTIGPMLSMVCVYMLLALSFFVVLRMGEISFGQQAFFGIGAYISAVLTTVFQWEITSALVVAGATAAGAAWMIGVVALRMSGFQFSLYTLVIAELVRGAMGRWTWRVPVDGMLAGPEGTMGFAGIDYFSRHGIGPMGQTTTVVAGSLSTLAALWWVFAGRHGRLLAAVAADRELADARGIPSDRLRRQAFALSGAVAGIGGALFAPVVTYIDPTNFGLMTGIHALAYTLIGGVGHVFGALAGTVLDVFFLEALRGIGRYRMVGFGSLIVIALIVLPRGVFAHRKPTRVVL